MQSSSDGSIVSGRGGKPVPIDTNKLKNIGKVMMPISFIFEMRVSLKTRLCDQLDFGDQNLLRKVLKLYVTYVSDCLTKY